MKLYRAFRLLALFASISLLFTSCGTLMQDGFSKQKYTGFKRGDGETLMKTAGKNGQESRKPIGVTKEQPDQPVQTPISTRQAEEETLPGKESLPSSLVPEKSEQAPVMKTVKEKIKHKSGKKGLMPRGDEDDRGFFAVLILILLCIFIPPLAVLIVDGLKAPFWIDLILWLIAIGAYFYNPVTALIGLIAIIYAFVRVF